MTLRHMIWLTYILTIVKMCLKVPLLPPFRQETFFENSRRVHSSTYQSRPSLSIPVLSSTFCTMSWRKNKSKPSSDKGKLEWTWWANFFDSEKASPLEQHRCEAHPMTSETSLEILQWTPSLTKISLTVCKTRAAFLAQILGYIFAL